MHTTRETNSLNIFGSIYRAQSLWSTFKNLLLIVEKVRWLTIAIIVTVCKNFIIDRSSCLSKTADYYGIKFLLALLGVKMNSRERDTINFAKRNKAIFLTNLSSSLDPLIARYYLDVPNYRLVKKKVEHTFDYMIAEDKCVLGDFSLAMCAEDAKHKQILDEDVSSLNILQEEDVRSHAPFNLFFEGLRTNNNVVSKPNKYVVYLLCHLAKKYSIPLCFVKIYHYNKENCAVGQKPFFQLAKSLLQYSSDVRLDFKMLTPDKINDSKEVLDAFRDLYGEDPKLEVCTLQEKEFEMTAQHS